jgi:hypothetical protein
MDSWRRLAWVGALLIALAAVRPGPGGEPQDCEPQGPFLRRIRPIGGWHPYGGGLLGWWDRKCFPRCGASDDYCRKPLPQVCWPPYPPYYTYGPPESCGPQGKGRGDCHQRP